MVRSSVLWLRAVTWGARGNDEQCEQGSWSEPARSMSPCLLSGGQVKRRSL